jgi:hypothetical protein
MRDFAEIPLRLVFRRTDASNAGVPSRAGRRESGGRCSRQPMGRRDRQRIASNVDGDPHHLRNVAPLLLDPDHSDADLRRMMISRTFGMSALSRTFGLSARSDVFKTECHSCGVLSEPNEPRSRHVTRALSCGTRSPIVAPPPKRPGEQEDDHQKLRQEFQHHLHSSVPVFGGNYRPRPFPISRANFR